MATQTYSISDFISLIKEEVLSDGTKIWTFMGQVFEKKVGAERAAIAEFNKNRRGDIVHQQTGKAGNTAKAVARGAIKTTGVTVGLVGAIVEETASMVRRLGMTIKDQGKKF